MHYQAIEIQNEGRIKIIYINRPAALNALNRQVFAELEHFFITDPPHPADVDGIIITGKGHKAFAAGADIKEFSMLDEANATQLSRRGQIIFEAIERFPKPVIAVVQGYALGGGCELAMACHLRIGGPQARFGQPEVNLGILPGYGATVRLVNLIGKARALQLLLTADIIDADTALLYGLLNAKTEAGEELSTALHWLTQMSEKAPLAISATLAAINNPAQENGYLEEATWFGRLATTADFKEGAEAFVTKRKPLFTGK